MYYVDTSIICQPKDTFVISKKFPRFKKYTEKKQRYHENTNYNDVLILEVIAGCLLALGAWSLGVRSLRLAQGRYKKWKNTKYERERAQEKKESEKKRLKRIAVITKRLTEKDIIKFTVDNINSIPKHYRNSSNKSVTSQYYEINYLRLESLVRLNVYTCEQQHFIAIMTALVGPK